MNVAAYERSYARVLGGEALGLPAAYVALQNAPNDHEGENVVRAMFRMQALDRRYIALGHGTRKRAQLPTE